MEKAKQLEKQLDEEITKLGTSYPLEVFKMKYLKKELETLSIQLENAHITLLISFLEARISQVEDLANKLLARDKDLTAAPTAGSTAAPTERPMTSVSTAPTIASTAAPTQAPTAASTA